MIQGITFDNQRVTASAHGALFSAVSSDGILTGCEMSINENGILCIAKGYILSAGRAVFLPNTQTVQFSASSGVGRAYLQIDLNQSSTQTVFEQASIETDYADQIANLATLTTEDVNNSGRIYQFELCVCRVAADAATEILRHAEQACAPLAELANTATHASETDYAEEAAHALDATHAVNADNATTAATATNALACSGTSAKASKLATARNIGNASFNGTADISLEQIGAAELDSNGVVAGKNSYAPMVTIGANATLTESHLNTMVLANNSADIYITVPSNFGTDGCEFELLRYGSGEVNVRGALTSVSFLNNGTQSNSFRITTRYTGVTFKRISNNVWVVFGGITV